MNSKPGSHQQEEPDPADTRAAQATQDESCKTGTRLGSNQQGVAVPAGTRIAQPAQDESCRRNMNSKLIHSNQQEVPVEPTADTENKPDTGLTSEVNKEINTDVKTDQATRQKNRGDSVGIVKNAHRIHDCNLLGKFRNMCLCAH